MNSDKVKWRKTWLKYLNGINKMHRKLFENDKREVMKFLENDWKCYKSMQKSYRKMIENVWKWDRLGYDEFGDKFKNSLKGKGRLIINKHL